MPASALESNLAPRRRLPDWLRRPLPASPVFAETRTLFSELDLHTVCESAKCPNRWECWSQGTAALMIAGDRCTRACGFCAVSTAKPFSLDADEPGRVAEAVARMKLRHVVITAVARDDLADGGSGHFARTIAAVRQRNPGIAIEVLTPDFNGNLGALQIVLKARPEIFNHNLETVRRLTPSVRSRATYNCSLEVLRRAGEQADYPLLTKSGLMLGLGEEEAEVLQTMDDLRAVNCNILTMGQYLQPTRCHLPAVEFIPPERFEELGRLATAKGFQHVASGPMVRSSYHAEAVRPALIELDGRVRKGGPQGKEEERRTLQPPSQGATE